MDLYDQLERALHIGSSGLEVLGAVGKTLSQSRVQIEQILGAESGPEVESILIYIKNLYGPSPTYN